MRTARGWIDWHHFRPWSANHWMVLVAVAAACGAAVAVGRAARRRGPATARRVDRWFGWLLLAVTLGVVAYNLLPSRRGWDRSLPLHVCHVAGFAAAAALLTRSRVARAVLYFVGLGLCTQAFVTPVLSVGPAHPDFWVCWAWHGGIMAAVAYDLAARRFRPTWRDWRLAVGVTAVFCPVVVLVNWRLGTMYGWLGPIEPRQWTLMTPFGPWPGRVPWLVLTAWGIMAVLAGAWPRNRRRAAWPHGLPVAGRARSRTAPAA